MLHGHPLDHEVLAAVSLLASLPHTKMPENVLRTTSIHGLLLHHLHLHGGLPVYAGLGCLAGMGWGTSSHVHKSERDGDINLLNQHLPGSGYYRVAIARAVQIEPLSAQEDSGHGGVLFGFLVSLGCTGTFVEVD
jgi:hypothetical protein